MQLTQLELCTVKIITFECGIATFWSQLTLQLIAWNINFLCSRWALSQVGRYGSFVGCPIRRYIFDDKKILKMIFFSFSQKSSVWNDSGFRQKDLEVHMSLSQGFLMIGFNDCFKIEKKNPMRRLGWMSRGKFFKSHYGKSQLFVQNMIVFSNYRAVLKSKSWFSARKIKCFKYLTS